MRILYIYKYLNLENNIFELYYYVLILYVKTLIYTKVISRYSMLKNFAKFRNIYISI